VKKNLRDKYKTKQGKKEIWWSFGSTTDNVDVLTNELFLGQNGERTMFIIAASCVKDISPYSAIASEKEFLCVPGTVMIIEGILPQGDLTVIQLKEIIDDRISVISQLQPIPDVTQTAVIQHPSKENLSMNTVISKLQPVPDVTQPAVIQHSSKENLSMNTVISQLQPIPDVTQPAVIQHPSKENLSMNTAQSPHSIQIAPPRPQVPYFKTGLKNVKKDQHSNPISPTSPQMTVISPIEKPVKIIYQEIKWGTGNFECKKCKTVSIRYTVENIYHD